MPENLVGTYTIDQDCALSLKYFATTGAGALRVTIEGILIDGGKSADLIVSDPPGLAVIGSLKAQ